MSDRLVSLSSLAGRTETSVSFWRKRIARGEVPAVRLGRAVRVREADAEAYLRLGLGVRVPARQRRGPSSAA